MVSSRRPNTSWPAGVSAVITPNRSRAPIVRREEVDDRLPRRYAADDGRVRQIEIHHKHAVARIGRLAIAVGLTRGIATFAVDGFGSMRTNSKRLDRLRRAVFEDLEVLGPQSLDELAVATRKDVDRDELDTFPEDEGLLRAGLLLRRRRWSSWACPDGARRGPA